MACGGPGASVPHTRVHPQLAGECAGEVVKQNIDRCLVEFENNQRFDPTTRCILSAGLPPASVRAGCMLCFVNC